MHCVDCSVKLNLRRLAELLSALKAGVGGVLQANRVAPSWQSLPHQKTLNED
jgi:hypothetical protein